MTYEECLARYGLPIAPEMRPEILRLSREMTDWERSGDDTRIVDGRKEEFDCDLRCLLLAQLFSVGALEDIFHIWRAKNVNMDSSLGVDVQLLCGAGLGETMTYLGSLTPQNTEAQAVLNYIRSCVKAGDFDGFTPAAWLAECQRYHSGDPTNEDEA